MVHHTFPSESHRQAIAPVSEYPEDKESGSALKKVRRVGRPGKNVSLLFWILHQRVLIDGISWSILVRLRLGTGRGEREAGGGLSRWWLRPVALRIRRLCCWRLLRLRWGLRNRKRRCFCFRSLPCKHNRPKNQPYEQGRQEYPFRDEEEEEAQQEHGSNQNEPLYVLGSHDLSLLSW
jgi:hypothetical protein